MTRKKFCLRWYYNWSNCYLFVNGTEIHKFKAKESETNPISLCTGNHLKDFFVDNLKKIEFYGYIYGFSVDYDALAVDDILGIQKYLMKTNDTIQNLDYRRIIFHSNDIFWLERLKCKSIKMCCNE